MDNINWFDKRYYSLNAYFKNRYGKRINKIAVDLGLSCPNRDGTIDNRGCIFCSTGGSGDFAVTLSVLDIPGATVETFHPVRYRIYRVRKKV